MRLVIFFLAILFFSCDSNRHYELNIDLEKRYWRVDEPLTYDFTIDDPALPYNVYYNIRNSLEYPYARLFVQYTLTDSTGIPLARKLDARYLFDQKTGKPYGQSGIGDVFDHQFIILRKHVFTHPGKYKLRLEQFNRQDTLKGILAVGVRVEKYVSK